MQRFSILLLPTLLLILMLAGFSGCVKNDPPETQPKDAVTAKEPVPFWKRPFQRKAAAVISSVTNTDKAVGLGVSGFALLILCAAVKFLSGSWRPAFVILGMGIATSACAVLLDQYSWVVLLIPIAGLAVLAKYVIDWWTGYRAWVVSSTEIENADTGEKSVGQRIKDRFAEAGLAPRLEKAVKMMEKLWAKQEPSS